MTNIHNSIQQLTIIGVGLIGGSFALALKQQHPTLHIIGCGRNIDNLKAAQQLGAIDRYHTDIAQAVQGSDLVFVAVPLGAMPAVFNAMQGHLGVNTIITDAGSAKASVVAAAKAAFGKQAQNFVPAHPIAGREKSSIHAALANLYQQRRVVITPDTDTNPAALAQVKQLWELTGAYVSQMSIAHHDDVLAATSHLPHILAYVLVDLLASKADSKEIFQYAAGGFRDFTRIAASDPVMWNDICVANKTALLSQIDTFSAHLQQLREQMQAGKFSEVKALFVRAQHARENLEIK